ncbi:MAG: pyridoxamine 5-phosphate oxidase-related FMN-binding protein [Ilumatobacteraceae bacterium]|nr:pyridoxamine 5-phosphate oxidase-related FMN-binding protein [Ilumatobacteraceae bacterium]
MTSADQVEFATKAERIVQANKYLTLATADGSGRPWASPVYFTPHCDGRFLWISSPDSRHSRNIAERADVAFTLFDSTVGFGQGEAVYCAARAGLVCDEQVESDTAAFVARFGELSSIGVEELRSPGPLRLYEAVVTEMSVLLRGDDPRNTEGIDTRVILR